MSILETARTQPLILDHPAPKPGVARRLPPELARRYHALPVAEDNGQITVMMANPHDAIACERVATALGTRLCVVWGDPAAIDALLAEVWSEQASCILHLLVCVQANPAADEVCAYARAIGGLLGAPVHHFPLGVRDVSLDILVEELKGASYDLIAFSTPSRSLIERLPTSLLIARRPRWPLKRMLLLIRGEESDGVALDWVVRLARPSGATVTVLTVVPPVPAMYQGMARMEQGLPELLATDTVLGQQMRRVARRLVNGGIEGTLRLRQGPPDWAIHQEVTQEDYDLLALATEGRGRWQRWLLGELIGPLLRWADQPVLIAKPKAT